MNILTTRPGPLTGSDAARQKINRALQLLSQTKEDNTELADVFESSAELFHGYEPHVKAIDFDRPSKDVSHHGTALREKADGATGSISEGNDELRDLTSTTSQILALVEGAKNDIKDSNTTALWRLESAENDLSYVNDSNIPGLKRASRISKRLLNEDLPPYLAEVEADEPGRDVGRFADDIQEIWQRAHQEVRRAPIYSRSNARQFFSAEHFLLRAKDAL